jgi:hypothetical protein
MVTATDDLRSRCGPRCIACSVRRRHARMQFGILFTASSGDGPLRLSTGNTERVMPRGIWCWSPCSGCSRFSASWCTSSPVRAVSWSQRSLAGEAKPTGEDGAIAGFQLGQVANWQSSEAPTTGITVTIPINLQIPGPTTPIQFSTGFVVLQQQLPQELTN